MWDYCHKLLSCYRAISKNLFLVRYTIMEYFKSVFKKTLANLKIYQLLC